MWFSVSFLISDNGVQHMDLNELDSDSIARLAGEALAEKILNEANLTGVDKEQSKLLIAMRVFGLGPENEQGITVGDHVATFLLGGKSVKAVPSELGIQLLLDDVVVDEEQVRSNLDFAVLSSQLRELVSIGSREWKLPEGSIDIEGSDEAWSNF